MDPTLKQTQNKSKHKEPASYTLGPPPRLTPPRNTHKNNPPPTTHTYTHTHQKKLSSQSSHVQHPLPPARVRARPVFLWLLKPTKKHTIKNNFQKRWRGRGGDTLPPPPSPRLPRLASSNKNSPLTGKCPPAPYARARPGLAGRPPFGPSRAWPPVSAFPHGGAFPRGPCARRCTAIQTGWQSSG